VITDDARDVTALTALGEGVFRQMLEVLPVAVYTTDAQGLLTYFNPAAVRLSGRVPKLGSDRWCVTLRIFTPDGERLPHDQCPMAITLKNGHVPDGAECVAERPDGSRFWFAPYTAVLRDTSGQIVGGINFLLDITERKMSETQAKEQFRAIVETTPECIKTIAADGTVLFMNPSGLAMVDASSAEAVTNKSVYELIAPEHRDRFRAFHERVCRGEKASLEYDMVGLKGTKRRNVESHAAPLRHADGSTIQLAIAHDVTERKFGERAAPLLGAIVDSSDDAIISKDLNGIVTSWNKSAERIFGYTAEEAIGRSIATLVIPPDRQDEEPDILVRLRRGERVDHFETKRCRKDGSLLDVSLTISPIKDARGTIIGASKIARDISESKRTQAALLASEANFRQLANAMPQIVWTADPAGKIDYYNERWFEFSGFGCDEQPDIGWEPILHPDDRQPSLDSWYASVKSGEPYNVEHRLFDRRTQQWRWFIGRAVAVRDASGNVTKWFGSCTDIDEQKRVQDDLRRANSDLEQFAFSASHDLQEPLRGVKIYTELLVKRHGDLINDEARKFLSYIRNGAARMEILIRDLLTYTHAAQFEQPSDPADANKALQMALANLAGAISEAGARITADPLPSVRMHATHLQQVFQNLIGNSIKYRSLDRPAVIHIGANSKKGECEFAVTDNGIGIDPQYKEKVFGLFKRLHTADEYSGTGIGLAICRRTVERYHGRIWVESEPGRGSTFRFTLPAW
jgi:PAS domain S-box-containing protein